MANSVYTQVASITVARGCSSVGLDERAVRPLPLTKRYTETG